jgi:creatinine amidohydrolase
MFMSNSRIMYNMTVEDVRNGLQEMRTIIIPIGVVEQHGYHLPLSVDIVSAEDIARLISERTGCFVAPTVQYCFSGGMLPGTINLSPQVYSLTLIDICRSLVVQGFKNIVFLLGHGGTENTQATKDAALMFQRLSPQIEGVCISVFSYGDFSPTCLEAFNEGDFHAGKFETSVMLHLRPEMVKMNRAKLDASDFVARMRTDPDAYLVQVRAIDSEFVIPKQTQSPEMNVGVMGDFAGATAEYGKVIVDEAVAGISAMIEKLEARL